MADRTCSIDGCESTVCARGWCRKHYNRWHKHGDPTYVTPWSPPPQNRPQRFGCIVDGCERDHHSRGRCHAHHTENWRRENPERAEEYAVAYREANREAAIERTRAWREQHPDRAREASARYHREQADKVRAQKRRYRDANRQRIRESNRARKNLKRGAAVAEFTEADWLEICEAFDHRCAYCGRDDRPLTQDHVIPLSQGGDHAPWNIVPACQPCNSKKGAGPAPPMVVTPIYQRSEA